MSEDNAWGSIGEVGVGEGGEGSFKWMIVAPAKFLYPERKHARTSKKQQRRCPIQLTVCPSEMHTSLPSDHPVLLLSLSDL